MKNLVHWLIYVVAVFVAAYLLPGVAIGSVFTALVVALILGILNTFVKPVLVALTLPITVITLGLFTFVINAALILLVAWFLPDFSVDSFWWALAFSVVLSLINFVLDKMPKK